MTTTYRPARSTTSAQASSSAFAEPDTVKELDRQLNLNEAVLRTKVIRPNRR